MGEHVFTLDKEKSRYLDTSHGRIHYKKHKGKTDWVVFIHGAGSNHSTWKPYLTEDISWIAFDLPGHGRSSRSNIFLDHMLEDLRRLIQKETTGKIILVGNSFGCIVAEKYYYRYPEDLVKLILMSPYSRNFSHFSFLFHSLSHVLYFFYYEGKQPTESYDSLITGNTGTGHYGITPILIFEGLLLLIF